MSVCVACAREADTNNRPEKGGSGGGGVRCVGVVLVVVVASTAHACQGSPAGQIQGRPSQLPTARTRASAERGVPFGLLRQLQPPPPPTHQNTHTHHTNT